MRRVFVLLVVLFALGGGAYAAWYTGALDFLPFLKAKDGQEGAPPPSEVVAKITFMHLNGLTLPVFTPDGVSHLVSIRMTIEVRDNQVAVLAKVQERRVQDALIRDLTAGFGEGRLIRSDIPDVEAIRMQTIDTLRQLLGVGAVRNVLIQAVDIRPV